MILGIDIGTSSVKAAILKHGRVVGEIVLIDYQTSRIGLRVEVNPAEILAAIHLAIKNLGPAVKRVDAIALAVMSPAWVAMDRRGKAITPIITHQDRRSVIQAVALEGRFGKARHLSIAGVRPVPGGVSSTTWAWYRAHHPSVIKRADLVGHLNTFLIRTWTGQRAIDPSNASFMGVYSTLTLSGWNAALCKNASLPQSLLPQIIESNRIAGSLSRGAAGGLGLRAGLPVLAGMIDTSAAMLAGGARVGQLLNTCGSTDVLALLTDRPRPDARLITRAFGIGKKWMAVSTLGAAGSTLLWAREQLFPDLTWPRFNRWLSETAGASSPSSIEFEPYLAGDRMSIEQPRGAFRGLTLASTRRQMLQAIIDALAGASAARLPLLRAGGVKIRREVLVTGRGFDRVMRRDWRGHWHFIQQDDATLKGLGRLSAEV